MKYEKWSLGYWCLKQYVIFADWLIHRKTLVLGKDRIPHEKPIVFAPNHQNALSDPLAVLLNTRFQPVWLARADIFNNAVVAKILRFLKIMPVYRMRDGKENLAKNDQTFADSIKVLENNFALALFPEAAHSPKRQMLVHKKAVPRIVFMAEEKTNYKLDIQIIPTGIYYSDYWKFNRTLVVNFGNPIAVKDFTEEYKVNPNSATLALRQKIYDAVSELIVEIKSKKYYQQFEQITSLYGAHFLKKQNKHISIKNRFFSDKLLAEKLDELESSDPEKCETIVKESSLLFRKIKQFKLRPWLLEKTKNNLFVIPVNKLILLLGLPVFIYGLVFNALPFFLIDRVIRKKVRDKSFWSTFFLVAGIILFPIFYVLELLAVAWLIPGIWLKLAFLISLPFAGKLAFQWYVLFRKTMGRIRLLFLKLFKNNHYHEFIQQKVSLFQKLDESLAK